MTKEDIIIAKLDQVIKLLGGINNAKPTTPLPAAPQEWNYVALEPWVRELQVAHCKIFATNWPVWQAMYEKYGKKLTGIAQLVDAGQRWPDQVQKYLDKHQIEEINAAEQKKIKWKPWV